MKKHLAAVMLLVILSGCASSAPAQTAASTIATTSNTPQHIQEQAENARAMRAEPIYNQTERLINQALTGSLTGEVSHDGDQFTLLLWTENGAAISRVVNNDDEMRDAWIALRDSAIQIGDAAAEYAENEDFPIYLRIYFVNENNHDDVIFTIEDGVVTQDASGVPF